MARILRELLRVERFASEADLREALKRRCARLRISAPGRRGYTDLVDRAMALVATNTRVVTDAVQTGQAVATKTDGRPMSRRDAAALFAELQQRYPSLVARSIDARRSA